MDLRNLEQIQEQEGNGPASRLGGWLLGGAGIGVLLLTVALSAERGAPPPHTAEDPLAELVAKARKEVPPPVDRVSRDNVTFSQILSDKDDKTTALVAVKDNNGQLARPVEPELMPPPPAADKLPIVPLPAGSLLEGARLRADPPDELTELAADRAQLPSTGERAQRGNEGQYQLQIASFRSAEEAGKYVEELRLRGHRAYSQPARVPNRGVWHRVRVGPFKAKAEAVRYKAEFERKEAMATFLVDPEKLERQRESQAARLAARGEGR